MRVAFIAPTSLQMRFGALGDFNLVLSHLLGQNKPTTYESVIARSTLPTIMDNGLFENKEPEALEGLLHKALRMKSEYVVCPDILFNREATEEMIEKTHDELVSLQKELDTFTRPRLMAVVQADNPDDFLESYAWLATNRHVDLIGLSILSVPKSFAGIVGSDDIVKCRLECMKRIDEQGIVQRTHLLGAGNSYVDVATAAVKYPWVVSHDSSSAIWNGLHEKKIDQDTLEVEGGKTPNPVDFDYSVELTPMQHGTIIHNIRTVLDAVRGHYTEYANQS